MDSIAVTRVVEFSASHTLHNPALDDAENARLYGKCGNPGGHGHNYKLEVTVAGAIDPVSGFVIDARALAAIIDERIVECVDHRNLNTDVAWLAGVNPTMENIAVAVWDRLAPRVAPARLSRIRLYETDRSFVEYFGG
jgi:6-pyruvoyltetrahydropterin/6-carboxytetrahydropterin synthase